ncbi:MAG: patatin-like phospholipase family protein [Chloroflexi bacterium]|nr:patatin-like phospholipase family protein [Chloroflexota bacterium]MCI0577476.1 patatin-like phospholipase family protein [Chloroflexota bacterium]MCI0647667.1 patatin-like phospholipase family protein [Chloroflexota bacterium]MCI0730097.1 patatin-like phospholipase family protein [Chloroflexota bacterium]
MPTNQRKRALVLSGGGGRGAYHVGVLRFLAEHEWFPDVVVGTSIGAVNGAALASGHTAQSLWALWRRLESGDVQKANLNPFKGNFILDTNPLKETLKRESWVNFDRVNSAEAAVHLRVTAMEVETGRLRVFGNSPDVFPSQMRQEQLGLDHIIASCSIPIIYPATELNGVLYWDGGTVANTPLSPAIDAGAEEIVVVIMTPWDDEGRRGFKKPTNLLEAAGAAFEWALLASFQADLKMFRRINELVRLQLDNAYLRARNAMLMDQLYGDKAEKLPDEDNDGIPDILEKEYHQLPEPIIVAPRHPIPVEQIIRYTLEGHEAVYEMGYHDAKRAWRDSGRKVEGE